MASVTAYERYDAFHETLVLNQVLSKTHKTTILYSSLQYVLSDIYKYYSIQSPSWVLTLETVNHIEAKILQTEQLSSRYAIASNRHYIHTHNRA